MSGFWELPDGEKLSNSGEYELGGDFETLPDNTTALAMIKEVAWKQYEGEEYINIQWQIAKPAELKNRVVFQKLKVKDLDSKKRGKALRMMNAIDINAGGQLPRDHEPNDFDLSSAWTRKMMVIKIKLFVAEDERKFNWIAAVSSSKAQAMSAAEKPAQQYQVESAPTDDDIPF